MGSAPLEETSLDTVGLNGTAREVNVIKLLQLLVDVVGIPVPRDDSAVEDLQHAVEHPRGGSALRVASEVLLHDCGEDVTLGAAQVLHLHVENVGFVDVVGSGARAVEGGNFDVVHSQTKHPEGTTNRRDPV